MKVIILSARYLFEENLLLEKYGDALNKVAPVSYYSDIDSGDVFIEMEVESLHALSQLSLELEHDLLISRPRYEDEPFSLWIKDSYME